MENNVKKIIVMILCLILTNAVPGFCSEKSEQKWLRRHPVIKMGLFTDIEPAMFMGDDGRFQGIIKDLTDIIGKRAEIKFEIFPIFPNMRKDIPEMLKQGKIDLFPGFDTPERRKWLNFTEPIYTIHWVIVSRSDIPFIRGLHDIEALNLKMVHIKNMKWHRKLIKDYPGIQMIPADTSIQALKLVSESKADAVILGLDVAAYLIRKHYLHNLKVAAPTGYPDSVTRLAVRKDLTDLAEILDKALSSVSHREYDEIVHKWLPVRFEDNRVWPLVAQWVLGFGTWFLFILGLTLFWNRRLGREVSERKAAEKSLQESNARNKAILSAIPDIMLIQNRDGVFLESHTASDDDFYLPPLKFIGRSPLEVLPEDLAKNSMNSVKEVFKTGKIFVMEYPLMFRDTLQHYEARMVPCTNETVLSIIRNITDRRQIEKALRESEEKFRNLVENMNDILYSADARGIINYISPSIENTAGYKPHEMIGRHMSKYIGHSDLSFIKKTIFNAHVRQTCPKC